MALCGDPCVHAAIIGAIWIPPLTPLSYRGYPAEEEPIDQRSLRPMTLEECQERWCRRFLWFLKDHWRHKENYDAISPKTPDGWAWEFLRRNPEYRKEFLDSYLRQNANRSNELDRAGIGRFWPSPPIESEGTLPDQVDSDGIRFVGPMPMWSGERSLRDWQFAVENEEAARKWRLRGDYLNPDVVCHFAKFWKPFGHVHEVYPDDRHGRTKRTFVVDLEVSWERQKEYLDLQSVKAIEEVIAGISGRDGSLGSRNVRLSPRVFREQLRLLDARASGATYKEIADVFFPKPGPNEDPIGRIDRKLQKARERQRMYREILCAAVDDQGYIREDEV